MYAVLAAVDDYAVWWPQVRSVARVDDETTRVVVRSVLPYTLRLLLTREIEDGPAGLLRAGIGGDLRGWSQWVVRGDDGHTVAEFTQEVEVAGALGAVARPGARLLRRNHDAMMRGGRKGLLRHLRVQG